MHLETIVVAICATIAVTVQYISHAIERKDLYSRIMARDLQDYTDTARPSKEGTSSKGNPIKRTLDKQYDLKER